jgi:hypothetical protein
MKARSVFYFGKFVVMGLAGLVLFTYVVLLLWNWLVPELFNGPELNYWQTLGILVLSKILFTGIGSGHRRNPSVNTDKHDYWSHDRPSRHRDFWKKRFEEKMKSKAEKNREDGEEIKDED